MWSKSMTFNRVKPNIVCSSKFKHSLQEKIAILIIYIDDIIFTGNDSLEISHLKKKVEVEFDIKDMGKLKYFLGMDFAQPKEGIFINQRKHILYMLKETGIMGCKATEMKTESNLKQNSATEGEIVERERYQRLVGRLIYLAHTRPNIAYVVSMVNQFMHSPGTIHFQVIFCILRYLKRTLGKRLLF